MQRRTDDEGRKRKIRDSRQLIYKKHYSVNSDPVEAQLKPTSLVPAQVSSLTLSRLFVLNDVSDGGIRC